MSFLSYRLSSMTILKKLQKNIIKLPSDIIELSAAISKLSTKLVGKDEIGDR